MKKTITQDGITYVYCYVKSRGTSWTYGYYPESGLIEAKAKKRKPTERKKLETKCDQLWGELVKRAWGNKCAICGKTDNLNSHHIITRSEKNTRWDVQNGICLCALHHTLSAKLSAHKTPQKFWDWLGDNHIETLEDIIVEGHTKPKKQDMNKVYAELKRLEREI